MPCSTNLSDYLVPLIFSMKLNLPTSVLALCATFLVTSCDQRGTSNSDAVSTSKTRLTNSHILSSLYGKSAGDSSVYEAGKLAGSVQTEKPIIANVIGNHVFTRHDSVFSLVFTKNQYDWGGVANSGWVDGALFHLVDGKWLLLRHKPQLLWGGTDGQCDCQSIIANVSTPQGEKPLAFIRTYYSHQGEGQNIDVVTDKLVAGNNAFSTYSTDGMCAYYVSVDTLKTGMFVKNTIGKASTFDLVSFETTRKSITEDSAQCSGKYQHRAFTYEQLMMEMQKPKSEE
jgi:hypothetical protein